MSRIELGDTARDPIVGLEGTVTARTEWLTGCDRLGIQRKANKDGTVPELWWVDEPIAELVKEGTRHPKRATGGPQRDPGARR